MSMLALPALCFAVTMAPGWVDSVWHAKAQAATVDDVLARFQSFRKRVPDFQSDYTSSINKGPSVTCFVRVEGTRRLLFKSTIQTRHYTLSETDPEIREIDTGTKQYDEFPYPGFIFHQDSRISGAVHFLTPWVLSPTLQAAIPRGAKFTLGAKTTRNGVECDHLDCSYNNGMASGTVDADISQEGVPMYLRFVSKTPAGNQIQVFELQKLQPLARVTQKDFAVDIPIGYVPYALPTTYLTPGIGKTIPIDGWTGLRNSPTLRSRLHAKTLLVLLGHDSPPTVDAMPTIGALARQVPLVLLSDAPSKGDAARADYYDPSQSLVKKIAAPYTPYFMLVDSKGRILKLWMGFDPDHASDFVASVVAAAR